MTSPACCSGSSASSCGCSDVLLYACSGAANVGVISDLAVRRAARQNCGAMFCLAAIGSRRQDAIAKARRARLNIVVDGCPLDCGAKILRSAGVDQLHAIRVTDLGVVKRAGGAPIEEQDVETVVHAIVAAVRGNPTQYAHQPKESMTMRKIEILGTGCPKCKSLEKSAREAVAHLGIDAEITKVDKMNDIVARGVMMTPALAIDGEVKSSGRVLSAAEVEELLA